MEDAVRRECVGSQRGCGRDGCFRSRKDRNIRGPDAAVFLDRIYTNIFSTLPAKAVPLRIDVQGKAGWSLMTVATTRLGKNHFLMTTTTGNAARVLAWLEEWLQTEWPDLKVYCTSAFSTTYFDNRAGGPEKQAASPATGHKHISKIAFSFMHSRMATIDGIPVRIARISFSGELALAKSTCWGLCPTIFGNGCWGARTSL